MRPPIAGRKCGSSCATTRPAAAPVGAAKLFGEEPGQQICDDLRRFKQVMETGEVVRSDGSLEGAGQGVSKQRPSQAPERRCGRMKATCWMGKAAVEVRGRSRPADPQSARRDRPDHVDGDLRLGPAPLQRLHADDEEGRRPRPRVHGRGHGGRPRRQEPQGRRPRGRALHHRLRQLLAVPARELVAVRELEPERRAVRETMMGHAASGAFGYSHLTGGFAGGQAEFARVPFADVGPLKIENGLVGRAGAVPLRHPADRLHGRRDVRHHSRATPSRSGAADRSGCSRSRAPICSARSG